MKPLLLLSAPIAAALASAQLNLYDRSFHTAAQSNASTSIAYDDQERRFTLKGKNVAYVFRIGEEGELIHEHFGGIASFSGAGQPVVDPTRTGKVFELFSAENCPLLKSNTPQAGRRV